MSIALIGRRLNRQGENSKYNSEELLMLLIQTSGESHSELILL